MRGPLQRQLIRRKIPSSVPIIAASIPNSNRCRGRIESRINPFSTTTDIPATPATGAFNSPIMLPSTTATKKRKKRIQYLNEELLYTMETNAKGLDVQKYRAMLGSVSPFQNNPSIADLEDIQQFLSFIVSSDFDCKDPEVIDVAIDWFHRLVQQQSRSEKKDQDLMTFLESYDLRKLLTNWRDAARFSSHIPSSHEVWSKVKQIHLSVSNPFTVNDLILNVAIIQAKSPQTAPYEIQPLWQEMAHSTTREMYHVLLRCWSHSKLPEAKLRIKQILTEMQHSSDTSIQPTIDSYNIMLEDAAITGDIETIDQVRMLTNAVGLTPTLQTYELATRGYAQAGRPDLAESIMQHIFIKASAMLEKLTANENNNDDNNIDNNNILVEQEKDKVIRCVERSATAILLSYGRIVHWSSDMREKATQLSERLLRRELNQRYGLVDPQSHDRIYTTLLMNYARGGRFELAEGLLKGKYRVGRRACHKLIREMGKANIAEYATTILEHMLVGTHGEIPNAHTFELVLHAWTKCRRSNAFDNALQTFDMLTYRKVCKKHEIVPTRRMYDLLFKCLRNSNTRDRGLKAIDLLDRFEGGTLADSPSRATYEMALEACILGRNFDSAVAILLRMENHENSKNVSPTRLTYRKALCWLSKRGYPAAEWSQIFLHHMEQKSIQSPEFRPDVGCYNIVLKTWSSSYGKLQRYSTWMPRSATCLKSEKVRRYLRHNKVRIISLEKEHLHRRRQMLAVESLWRLFERIVDNGNKDMKPNALTYQLVLDCLNQLGSSREALERAEMVLLHMIQDKSIDSPSTISSLMQRNYEDIIQEWLRLEDYARASRIFLYYVEQLTASQQANLRAQVLIEKFFCFTAPNCDEVIELNVENLEHGTLLFEQMYGTLRSPDNCLLPSSSAIRIAENLYQNWDTVKDHSKKNSYMQSLRLRLSEMKGNLTKVDYFKYN